MSDWPDYDYDEEEDGASETVRCRSCGADVYEDAFQCPVCNEYLTRAGGATLAGRPLWFVLLALAGIAALIYALVVR